MKGCKYFFVVVFFFVSNCCFSQEICNNGKDDDGDGLTDLQDPDCQCHFTVSGNLLQNGSFELHNACPVSYSYSKEGAICDFWKYGTYTNINTASYYHNFSCAYDSGQVMLYLPPALPLPDGNAFMSITQYVYKEPEMQEKDLAKVYISQCLNQPLAAGIPYTLSFSAARFQSFDDPHYKFKTAPFTVAIFGNSDCNAVPFGALHATSNGCPANYSGWQLLGKVKMSSKGKWTQNKISFTAPANINVIAIGPDCSLIDPAADLQDSTTYLDFYVYDLDDVHLLPTTDFHFQHIESQKQNVCDKDSVLSVPLYANTSYQWYKDSIAIGGATTNAFHLPAENATGNYNVLISNVDSCVVSEPFSVTQNPLQALMLPTTTSICDGESLLLAPAIDGISYTWNDNQQSFVTVYNEGIYDISASSLNGCSKTFTVKVNRKNCSVLMPDAFTPNNDGKNDVFRIPPAAEIDVERFAIYDRWGNRVFVTNNKDGSWDGNYKGSKSAAGIYIYIIEGTKNHKKTEIRGFVTLIR